MTDKKPTLYPPDGCALCPTLAAPLSMRPRPVRCGKWQEGEFPHVYKCSACGRYTDWISHGKLPPPPFFCWCGAKMEN